MKAKRPRKSATVRALERTLRAMERFIGATVIGAKPPQANGSPPRFIQCWTQQRGAFGVLHALDAEGQVWQLHTTLVDSKPTEQWWSPISMERRKA